MIMARTQFTRNNLQTRSILIQFILKKKKKERRQVQWLIYLTVEKFWFIELNISTIYFSTE